MKKLILICLCVLCIACGAVFMNVQSKKFNKESWTDYPDRRYKIVDDLKERIELKGKTQEDVQEILGEPDDIWELGEGKEQLLGYVYYLGEEPSLFSLGDSRMYFISFKEGFVIGTSIQ